jgi:serine/threonine protein kinase/tetratricopeptide (TPR) repeat protein
MPAAPNPVQTVFEQANELSDPAERAAFLDRACAGDPALRDRVEALLRAHAAAGSFLSLPPAGVPADQPTADHHTAGQAGTVLAGRYKLVERIGEGGMGEVWMADQTEPVKRLVAVKLIKAGMDSKAVLARFEAERQALALMDHPNIAKVLDGGAAPDGRPFFVMELVKGTPITRYCDDRRLTPRQRLELFVPVCQAIQHAHQKGVIHRDIKPSNVLVARYDDRPVPKVIDFGVAKAAGQALTEQTLHTGFGAVVGTVEYMSPEQATFNQLDVDTRSDVYSLGVVLYELLAGSPPFSKKELEAAGMLEMLRVIREKEPSKPSTKLSTADGLPTLAANRGTEPARLTRLVRGELDWIVMKALEKDRSRRYETANGFAIDILHYLADEPVLACPPSAGYRLRKFARRNKAALAVVCVSGLIVFLAIGGLAINNWLVTREKDQKVAALTRVVEEKKRGDENLARARQAVKEYLLKTSDSPQLKAGDFQQLRKELLETAIPFYLEFVRQQQDDPDVETERGHAYDDLGFVHRELGDLQQAVADFEKEEEIFLQLSTGFPDKPLYRLRVAEARISRGDNLVDLGKVDPAEHAYRNAIELLERQAAEVGGPEFRESLARAANSLGLLLQDSSRPGDAEQMLRRAITLREQLLKERPQALELRGQLAQSWVNLGGLQHTQRRDDDAQQAFQQCIDLLDLSTLTKFAGNEPVSARYLQARAHAFNNLGIVHNGAGRFVEAEKAYREALTLKEKLADRFPSVPQFRLELARSFNNQGALLAAMKRPKDAQSAYEKAVGIYERLIADSRGGSLYSVGLAGTYTNLGKLMSDNGQLEQSLPILAKGVDILEAALREDPRLAKAHESLLVARWARATTLAGLRRFQPAVEDWTRAMELDDGRYYGVLRIKRASTFLNLKDHVRATADAQAIGESPKATAVDLYNAACVYAQAARLVSDDMPQVERYGTQAVELLRKALISGFKDRALLKKDSDLDPVRMREDFKKLMTELEPEPKKRG